MVVSLSTVLVWCLIAYIVGSTPSGYVLVKLFLKQDVRQKGSGNIGATNVLRVGNKHLAVLTYAFDMVKIWLPLWAFAKFINPFNDIAADIMLLYLAIVGACGVIGHMYSFWLGFKGGKGVASVGGYFLWLFPYVAVMGIIIFIIIAFATRIVSVASLVAVLSGYIYVLIYRFDFVETDHSLYWQAVGMLSLVVLLIFWRHKDNIKRLIGGTENKIQL